MYKNNGNNNIKKLTFEKKKRFFIFEILTIDIDIAIDIDLLHLQKL